MSKQLVLTETRRENGRVFSQTWEEDGGEKKEKELTELKRLKILEEKNMRENLFLKNEIKKLSDLQKGKYFIKLFFLKIIEKNVPFFEISYKLPLSCFLTFNVKRGKTKRKTEKPVLETKKNTKKETAAIMRAAKDELNYRNSEELQLKKYLTDNQLVAMTIFNTKIEFEGLMIDLIQFSKEKSFPMKIRNELNASLQINKSRVFYNHILRSIQRLIELDGFKFFTQDENI